MSSLHQDLTDQFWQGLTVQERQLIMITHQNGIGSPAPSLNPRRVDDTVHAFLAKALDELFFHLIEPWTIEELLHSHQ